MSESFPDQPADDIGKNIGALHPYSQDASFINPEISENQLPHGDSPELTSGLAHPTSIHGFPKWIRSGLNVKAGRDPLGLQTTTVDLIMQQLLSGILALSQRAR